MTEQHESSAISTVSLPVQTLNTFSKSTNIYVSISQQSVLFILTAFVNSPAGRITVEKIGLRYITIANTTPHSHITHITNCQPPPHSRALYMWTAPNNKHLINIYSAVLSKTTVTAVQAILRKRQKRVCEYAIKLPLLFMIDIYIIIKLSKINFI